MTGRRPTVLKFGGAALAEPTRVVDWVRRAARTGPVVVVASAREGVTDRLRAGLARPTAAVRESILEELRRRHRPLDGAARRLLERFPREWESAVRRRAAEPWRTDAVLSVGERLAAGWLAQELRAAGCPARAVASDRIGLTTDNRYGASEIRLERSAPRVRAGLLRWLRRGEVPVVTGFFGRSLEGHVATLGRGGSDYTATALGAILHARRVELVKHGVSLYSADPRLVPAARPIRRLSYGEAEELAQFGARVLHPLTVEPARRARVEVRVSSLDDPATSTSIGPGGRTDGSRALTLLSPVGLLRLRVPGGRQRPGVVAEVSRRLSDERINVVTMFTSSTLLTVVLERALSAAGRRALAPMAALDGISVGRPEPVGLITAIGDGILGDLRRVPPSLLDAAAGLSATPRSLTLAVPVGRGPATLAALHHALVERDRP